MKEVLGLIIWSHCSMYHINDMLQPEFYEGEIFLSERFCQAAILRPEPIPPPQPGAGQLGALGQPQPWASGASLGTGLGRVGGAPTGRGSGLVRAVDRFSTESKARSYS